MTDTSKPAISLHESTEAMPFEWRITRTASATLTVEVGDEFEPMLDRFSNPVDQLGYGMVAQGLNLIRRLSPEEREMWQLLIFQSAIGE